MKLIKADLLVWPKHNPEIATAAALAGEGVVCVTTVGELAFTPTADRRALKLHPASPAATAWKQAPYDTVFEVSEIL